MLRGVIVAAVLAALPALAETTARPEALIVFSDEIRMGARLVGETGDALVMALDAPATIKMQAGFWTDAKATSKVRLRCQARFVMADGRIGNEVMNTICHSGDLAKTANSWTLLDADLLFIPDLTDPAGIMGVELRVTDEVGGTTGVLQPTFDWQGGQK